MYLGFCYLTTASETANTSPLIKSKEFAWKVAIIYLPLYQTSTESARVADQLITTGFNNPRRVLVFTAHCRGIKKPAECYIAKV